MTLKEKLQDDWKTAMKAKDSFRSTVISMARAAILQEEKTNNIKLDDEGVITILSKEVKQRRESIAEFEKGSRQDLVDQTKKEIDILLEYLPQQLTAEQIEEIVKGAVNNLKATSMKEMGKVMAAIMPDLKGKADGKLVNQIVKKYLN
jgi:uncharacterized protein YqeY